ncbi:MAG: alpha/beta fold hydrolase [Anaerolineales bacterium]|nr:alpha/beta fold hydrolase [Anaerolineales bacterium]
MKRILIVAFLLSACAAPTPLPLEATATLVPSASPAPTNTSAPPPPSATSTLTAKQSLAPYTIDGLRARKYDEGAIFVGAAVLETEIFTRYPILYSSDGLTISGVLQIPKKGEAPFPVIVMNHGFFSRYVYRSGDGTDRAANFLNQQGYLTVSSDYRSWGASETAESLFYSGQVIDVIHLINALPSIPQADAKRVGMWGHSMGGGIAVKALTILGDRVKAAVLYSPVSADFADLIGRWGPGCMGDVYVSEAAAGCNSSDILPLNLPPELVAAYFNATTDSAILKAVSPLYYFDLIQTPIQIAYGTNDGKTPSGTPPEWSRKMYDALTEAGANAEIFAYQGEGHSFVGDPWYVFMGRTQRFFDKYVK